MVIKNVQQGLTNKVEKWREFGRLILNQVQLNHDNTLNVKYKKSNGSCKILKTSISDEFKNLINKIFDTSNIDYTIGKILSDDEKKLFKTLLDCADLSFQLNYNPDMMVEDINDLKKRFSIIKGEIIAGNNNKKMLSDAIIIVKKLITLNEVSESDGKEIIDELEEEIKN